MSSIGTHYDYPEHTFTECLGWVEKAGRDKIRTFDTFTSEVLGHTNPRSGGVNVKMAALNKYYGLLEKAGDEVKLTPTGERVVFPLGEATRAQACREAIFHVPLLKDLYGRLGSEYHHQDFRPVLQQLSGAKPDEVLDKAEEIEQLYRDAVKYLGTAPATPREAQPGAEDRTPSGGSGRQSGGQSTPQLPSTSDPDNYHVYQTGAGDTFVRVKRDIAVLEAVQGMIGVWLEIQKKSAPRNGVTRQPADETS